VDTLTLLLILFSLTVVLNTGSAAIDEFDLLKNEQIELPIIMYHHLSYKSRLWGDYVISPDLFEEDLKYFKDAGYESITVNELISWSEGKGALPEKPIMITFDDGFEAACVYAEPLLKKYGYTAVMAVIGSTSDLFTRLPDHMLDYSHLCWDDVRRLSLGNVFEIQSHTFNLHTFGKRRGCSKMKGESFEAYRAVLRDDFNMFQARCEEYGVLTCPSIAFPFGLYSSETIEIIKELGYKASFICAERINHLERSPDYLHKLCRFNRRSGKSSESFFKGIGVT